MTGSVFLPLLFATTGPDVLKYSLLALTLGLTACAPALTTETAQRRAPLEAALPPMKTFTRTTIARPTRSNAALARDFLDLSFRMESGRELPVLTRFEEPVTLRVLGRASSSLGPDLSRLLGRLQREAKIDIRSVPATDTNANITIQALARRDLQRIVPKAACFVAPRVSGWAEYKRLRRTATVDWTTLTTRDRVSIFIPGDVSPQEIRDCLHEELAQALGPLNDLYRLPDSVFNDDNFHAVLTGFDMLMLRVYYAPELRSGMSRAEVARRLPTILARVNPAGRRGGKGAPEPTPRAWINAIETALGPRASITERRRAALRAVEIAEGQNWRDSRYAFSLFALGRLSLARDPEVSLAAFLRAGRIYANASDTRLQASYVAMQMAAFALSAGQAEDALRLTNAQIETVSRAENAALLATLLMIKAEALDLQGRSAEAEAVRLDSLGWARYGFGSDRQVRARLSEIASLSPKPRGS